MKRPGERFHITLRRYWMELPPAEYTRDAAEFRDQLIYYFEVYGAFLDPIPISERMPYVRKIVGWASLVPLNFHIEDYNTGKPSIKPSREIKKDLKKIQETIELLEDLDREHYLTTAYTQKETTLRYLKNLENDLAEKRFMMIHKSRYYKVGFPAKRQELKEIILEMIQVFDLKVHRKEVDDLVSAIPITISKLYEV